MTTFFGKPFLQLAIVAASLSIFIQSSAPAGVMLVFDNSVDGGTISYDGLGGPLFGTDILFDAVTAFGTPLHDGVTLDIIGGRLNFETGPNLVEGPILWEFDAGGMFELTGTVMHGVMEVASGVLVTGSWTGAPNPIAVGGVNGISIVGFGVDEKHEGFYEFYGIPEEVNFRFANTEISGSLDVFDAGTGAFSGTVFEADLVNSQPVPEPSAFLVWGCLMGTVIVPVWRRVRRTAS